MKRKICFITGTRAEYGLLRQLILSTSKDKSLISQIIVTGSHLSRDHGLTYKEIEADGLAITNKVNLKIKGDSPQEIINSMSEGLKGFSKTLSILKPDLVIILGDRYEIFAAASTAMILNIPIAHIHGGETTEGAYDEAMRHSITKMSHLHFVAADEYRMRVIQLGEHPNRVFNVGGMGVDAIKRIKMLSREELERSLDLSFGEKSLLVTFHPVTLEGGASSVAQMRELLVALESLGNTTLIFTMPNADTGGRELGILIRQFVEKHPCAKVYTSLGQLRYLSCLAQVDGVVGNSSSGILETPSYKIGTVNIGDRQKGRLKADSVIDTEPKSRSILAALKTLYSTKFQANLTTVINPYDNGESSETIVKLLAEYPLDNICKKQFYNLPLIDLAKAVK